MLVGCWPKESGKVQRSCWDSLSPSENHVVWTGWWHQGCHGAKQRSWKTRAAGIPNPFGTNPSGQHCQSQAAARNPAAFSLKRWEMIAETPFVLDGVSGREPRTCAAEVTRWGSHTWQVAMAAAQGWKWSGGFCRLDPKSARENRRNPPSFTNLWTRL